MNLTLGILLAPLVLGLLVTLWMTRGSAEPRLLAAALVLPALGLRHLLDPPSATGGGVLELLADGRGESLMASFAANLLAAFAVGALGYSLRERNRAERLQWDSMESLRALIGFFGSARASSDDRISELLALGCRVLGLEVGMLLRDRGGRFEVLATSAPADFPLAVGSEVMLPEAVHEGIASGAVAMEDRAFSPSPGSEAASLRSSLSHRVEAAGEPSCVLCFASPTARHRRFGDVDKQLLSLTAHCVAEELRQRRADRDRGERARRQATTVEISQRAAGAAAGSLDEVVTAIARTLSVPLVAVLEHRPEEGALVVVSETGWQLPMRERRFDAASCGLQEVLAGGELVRCPDRPGDGEVTPQRAPATPGCDGPIESAFYVPIRCPDAPSAILCVGDREPRRFSVEELDFVRVTANLLTSSMRVDRVPPHAPVETAKRLVPRRGEELDRRRLDVASSIAHLEPELRRALGDRELRLDLDPLAPEARVYRYEFDRVLWSLVAHAADIAPPHSPVTLRSARLAPRSTAADGAFVVVSVEVDGAALDADALAALFDDTRPGPALASDAGPTRRLGLARVERLLRDAGGDLSLHSEHDRGTQLSAYLPTASPAGAEPPVEPVAQ